MCSSAVTLRGRDRNVWHLDWVPVAGPERVHAIRLSRCSPTRMALAMAVSAGFTAPMLGEEAGVDDVQVVELMGLAVDVENRGGGVGAEPAGARLVSYPGHGDVHAHVEVLVQDVVVGHPDVVEDLPELVVEAGRFRLVDLVIAVARYFHARDSPASRVRPETLYLRVHQQRHVRLVQQGTHSDDLSVGLCVHEARIAVAPGAADALARWPVGLIQQDAARRVERMVAAC